MFEIFRRNQITPEQRERERIRRIPTTIDLYKGLTKKDPSLRTYEEEDIAVAEFPRIEIDGSRMFDIMDTSFLSVSDRRLVMRSVQGLPATLTPEFQVDMDDNYGLDGVPFHLMDPLLIAKREVFRNIHVPEPVPEQIRRSGGAKGGLIREPDVSSLDEALLWIEKNSESRNSRHILFGYNLEPSGTNNRKRTLLSETLAHEHFSTITLNEEGGTVYCGRLELPLAAFMVDGADAPLHVQDEILERYLDHRKGQIIDYRSKRTAILLHLKAIRTEVQNMRKKGLPLALEEGKGEFTYDRALSPQPEQAALDRLKTNGTHAAQVTRELQVDMTRAKTVSLQDAKAALDRQFASNPRIRAERLVLPADDRHMPELQESIAFHQHWRHSLDSCPRIILEMLDNRSHRMFGKKFSETSEDELIVLSARSLFMEMRFSADEVSEIFLKVDEKISEYKKRLKELGKGQYHTVDVGWKTFGFVGSKTIQNNSDGVGFRLGSSFSYDAAWLNVEKVLSLEEKKQVVFHEFIHNLQSSNYADGNLTKVMDRKNPTTYIEAFTDWISQFEFPLPYAQRSKYRDGADALNDFIVAQTKAGVFDANDLQDFYDAAITANFDRVRIVIMKAGTTLEQLLAGFSDADYYRTPDENKGTDRRSKEKKKSLFGFRRAS